MKAETLAATAAAFADEETFYEYGGWGQEMTLATMNALAERYPKNKPVKPENVGKWGFDCICMIKGILAGVTPAHHINSYQEMKTKCPIGDCTNVAFLDMLYDRCKPSEAPIGYGLANKDHAAISLGNNRWVDANRCAGQDGVKIHVGIPDTFVAGKIPGVEYESPSEDEVQEFLAWLYQEWRKYKNGNN